MIEIIVIHLKILIYEFIIKCIDIIFFYLLKNHLKLKILIKCSFYYQHLFH